jgi:hypothetical protein
LLEVVPISIKEANEFVLNFHRHNKPTQGGKYAIGAVVDKLYGVAIVGRPIARLLQDGVTAEVARVCVLDESPKNTCSFLYGRCWRILQQMGGKRMITYTLQEESGASLRGVGWKITGVNKGGDWDREKRKRDWQPIYGQLKFRWEVLK